MFLALRELRFARGRFALIAAVIALITLLVGLLSGLTAGLSAQSISAISSLSANQIAFSGPADGKAPSFAQSRVDDTTIATLRNDPSVISASPIGIAQTTAMHGDQQLAVAAFGVAPGDSVAPRGVSGDEVVISSGLADDGVKIGDQITLGTTSFTVAGTRSDAWYNHTPVIYLDLTKWQQLPEAAGAAATVVALNTAENGDVAAVQRESGTVLLSRSAANAAIGSYTAENGSLSLIRWLLLGISAVVVGAFFTVWTMQRKPDIAVLKAIGASDAYVARDAAAQALVVLLVGGAVGMAVVAGIGALIGGVVPFVVDPSTTLVPLGLLLAFGMVGALVALRQIFAVEPIAALGAAR